MRGYKAQIEEAELLASPPEAVAAFLKARSELLKTGANSSELDREFENALRSRGDPRIDFALARYGRFGEVLKPIFQAAAPTSAIRLAALSNSTVGGGFMSQFPFNVIGPAPELVAWLNTCSEDEIEALFDNPLLADSFLTDMMRRERDYEGIYIDRLARFVMQLSRNPRMVKPYDEESDGMDGYAEYSHGAVFDAGWSLCETAPTTRLWAAALSCLYDRMLPDSFSIKAPLDHLARWASPTDEETVKDEASGFEGGWLSDWQGVRKGIGKLALHTNGALLADFLVSEDPALRCAAYAEAALTPDQLTGAHERDKSLAWTYLHRNQKLWRTAASRQVLHDIAWAVCREDKHSDMLAPNTFNYLRSEFAKKNPQWFADEEDWAPEPDSQPATKADVQAIHELVATQNAVPAFEGVMASLKTLQTKIGWIWWMALGGLLVAVLKR
ncbi:MAG: hypothetical protein A2711_12025 [Burkholderiales bacterium RIFCSPHIGHO2_01_FULL_63_240]|nr:MAG: hypothetical protein A2711_12025 [Burkholderiales bacterium RIFCSPHIGHO2_01_FULL_63_240]